jgi:hypothetical protein
MSTKDLDIDSSQYLVKFINRFSLFLSSNFIDPEHSPIILKIDMLKQLYDIGLREIADFVIANE